MLLFIVANNLTASNLYQTTADLNLRKGPGSKNNIIITVKSRKMVSVIEKTNSLWFKVEYNGKIGYLSSKYLIPIVAENPKTKSQSEYSNSTLFLTVGIIVIIILIIIILTNKEKPPIQVKNNFEKVNKSEKELKEELASDILKNMTATVTTSSSDNSFKDDTIIDVTGNSYSITPQSNKEKPPIQVKTNFEKVNKSEKELKEELVSDILKNITVTAITSRSDNSYKDDSIIDVTENSYSNTPRSILVKYSQEIPFWSQHYVYSHTEINDATSEQIKFYNHFKNCFLQSKYFDLEGNTNYAFILLFDLVNDYEIHQNIARLERELNALGKYYPKTRSYAVSLLIRNMESKRDSEGLARIKNQEIQQYQSSNYYGGYDPNEFRLGNKFRDKLNLNDQEVTSLNKFWNPNNVFLSIEGCCIETMRLYLAVLKEMNKVLENKGSEFAKEIDYLKGEISKYRQSDTIMYWGEYGNSYLNDQVESEIFNTIFRRAENCIREYFGHKRKVSADFSGENPSLRQEFESRIGYIVDRCIEDLKPTISQLDKKTEIQLNYQNVNRWKNRFEVLCKEFKEENIVEYIKNIHLLGTYNKKNPNIEHIFFEASKYIAKYDKVESLKFYIYYLYYDLKSVKVDNKQYSKTIQKTLFNTNEQLHNFEIIVGDLIKTKNLKKALKDVSTIYVPQRKKIQLDISVIEEVKQKHSGTVELLNEYLNDEYEDESNSIKVQEINNEEVKIEIVSKDENNKDSIFKNEINLTQIHTIVLKKFVNNEFALSEKEIVIFAKSNGVFKNQLIESINDNCYEYLEDVLIEEEQETYLLNKDYYQRILKNDR